MKKILVFLVLSAMLLSLVWVPPRAAAAPPRATSALASPGSGGVRLAARPEQPVIGLAGLAAAIDPLYPDDIDPPETCHVPSLGLLGEDVEMMLGPWGGPNALLALDQPSTWNEEAAVGVPASTDLDVIALNSEELVAAWADLNMRIRYATWGAGSGWTDPVLLGTESATGKPALLSRGPIHWAVFARFNARIRMREWYMGSLGDSWQELPGIDDADSDPVVVAQDAGHMAVFYRTAAGEVKFSEWEGAWLENPVSLGQPSVGEAFFPIASELSAVSRGDTQTAVLGVDASGQLWFRERAGQNELDWSDTAWVKLLQGVEIAKPAVASRHANHIGVVVKDGSGRAYYTRWTRPRFGIYLPLIVRTSAGGRLAAPHGGSGLSLAVVGAGASGWSEPVPLGDAAFVSPLTLALRGIDSLVVVGVQADENLYENHWTEDDGWASWQAIGGPAMKAAQVVAAVMRRPNDVLLLGRYTDNQAWSKHYTSLDKPVTDEDLSAPLAGLPRAQTLAIVDGRWLWVSLTRAAGGTWQAQAREISTGITAYLDLGHADSGQATNRVAVAAADLDVDGRAEVVVATLQSNRSDIDLSVLELSFQDPTTLVISASPLYTWPDPQGGEDVNVAIGDLDGDQEQDEVVVGYRSGSTAMRFGIFHYTESGLSPQGGTAEIDYPDWCAGLPGCTVGDDHDLEIAIGRVIQETTPPLEREQLVVLDVTEIEKDGVTYAQDWVVTRRLISDTWTLEPVGDDCSLLDPSNPGNPSSIAGDPYAAALGTGDMDADAHLLENIVYSFGDRLAVITDPEVCEHRSLSGLPDQERSLAMGDVDTDGRREAVVGYRDANTEIRLFEMVEEQALRTSAQRTVNGSHSVLVGDTDNDTQLAELAGCKTFAEVHVVAVVNSAPRWYAAGQPIQGSGGLYGRTESGGGGTDDGTIYQAGASLTLGLKYTFNTPVLAIKLAEIRASVKGEIMTTWGTKTSTVWSLTQEMGYEYEASSLGMVVYNSTEYTCYYYDVYPPSEPESRSRAMLCTPTGRACAEDFKALEDWHAPAFKQAAGPSWVDVGHRSPGGLHTNDLEVPDNYLRTLPVEASRVMYTWDEFDPVKVSYSSLGGFTNYWHISDMEGGASEAINNSEANATVSAGADAGVFTLDLAYTRGIGWENSSITSWEETLEIGGAVEKYQDPDRLCYDIVPFVYRARAKTEAGVTYPYLEMDYYVPIDPYPCARETEGTPLP